ncbi:MAG: tetratricopeptide repeat protein [Muribaculum sp.]|nr:tetratricopeptide repeat protein [Muribaculaceae bacterium]MCM1080252.1 tetratricopeptide repeat protein [Muribaculum sp.]
MKQFLFKSTIIACSMVVLPTLAQVNTPAGSGYASRAELMEHTGNYQGALDQLMLGNAEGEDAVWLKAQSNMQMGRIDRARNELRCYLATWPASAKRTEAFIALCDCDFYQGEYKKALLGYDKVRSSAIDKALSEDMSYKIAYCRMMLGEDKTAMAGFQRLAAQSNRYAGASRFYQGYLNYRSGNYSEAVRLFESVDPTTPPGSDSRYYLTQIAYRQGDYSKAFSMATDALNSGKHRAEMCRLAGESAYYQGNSNEASRYLNEYMRLENAPEPSAMYILGAIAYGQGDYQSAITCLTPVAEKCNNAMGQSAYLYIGQSLLQQGEASGAMLALEKAWKMNFDKNVSETAMYNYIAARMDGGRTPFGSSVTMLENFLSDYPNSQYAAKVQECLITGYMTDNNYDKALVSIERIKRPSAQVLTAKQRVLYELGVRDLAAKNVKQALSRFEQAKALEKYNKEIATECDLWIGDCYYRLGRYAESSRWFTAYLRNSNISAHNIMVANYDLAYSKFAERKYNEARTIFKRVVDNNEADSSIKADANNRIGDCYYYASDFAHAGQHYDKALSENPGSGDYAIYQKAIMRGLQRDHNGKIDLLNDMMSRYPRSGLMPSALLEKADSQIALNQTENALSTYEKLVNNYGSTQQGRQGCLQMAITLMSAGNHDKAIDAYRRVIKQYPTSQEARIAADDLKHIYADDGRLSEYMRFIASVPQAPKLEVDEADELTFQSAEKQFLQNGNAERLTSYITSYPDGRYMAQALGYLSAHEWQKGNAIQAFNYAKRLVDEFPDAEEAEDALALKGNIELEQGDTDAALETFRQLSKKASAARNVLAAQAGIMRVSRDMGKYNDIIDAADKILGSTSISSELKTEAAYLRAYALSQTGKADKAVATWEELAKNPNEIYGAQSAYYLAQYRFDNGETKKARSIIEKFIDANSPHHYWIARGYILLSDILRKQGNDFEANEYLKSLKENYPGAEADIFQMIDQRI